MDDQNLKIKITAAAELSALKQLEDSLSKQMVQARALGKDYQHLENDLKRVQSAMASIKPPSFGEKFKQAASEAMRELPVIGPFSRAFNGNVPVVGLMLAGLVGAAAAGRELLHVMKELSQEGMRFNRFLQDSNIALAGGFRSVDPSLSFAEAKQKGGEAIDALKAKALSLGINFESLVETFKVNVPTMWEAGIRDTQKMINLITLLNQVAAAKGIDGFQAQRDIIDLLNGMGQRTILGKELEANGVSNESIKAAKEQGTLYELLTSKLSAYGEAGNAASETQTAALNRLHTSWESLLGAATKPFFDDTTKGIGTLTAWLNSLVGSANEAGVAIKGIVAAYRDLAGSPEFKMIGKARDITMTPQRMMWDATVGKLIRADEDRGREAQLEEKQDAQAKRLYEQATTGVQKSKADRFDRDNNWNVPLDAAHAAQMRREKDTADAEAAAERDRKINALPPLVRAGALEREIRDTRQWTNDSSRSDDDKAAGKKKLLDLDKQLAAVEKQIDTDAWQAGEDEKKRAAKREELDLELAIQEAKASGNDKLADKLEWQRKYNALLKERLDAKDPDAWNHAIRGANAADAGSPSDPIAEAQKAVHLSSAGRLGMAMGESLHASPVVDKIASMIKVQESQTVLLQKIVTATQKTADKTGGYQ